ncbi:hypothetical protein VaNZ11_008314 [Volvox africanus]|uniref:Auxin efflux carrier component n=1 Tax=Volvox africanus TaxID=51714 RepID=A0ABQ5S4T9_9CHLO|nr:hypothetical protein VaNZ11_008314 [Volvox africanus]
MGAWAFQNVLNVGIQIVLIVFSGWCFARFRLLTAEHFMGQINVLLLRVAFPMLNIYLLGIKVDLRDAEAWRSLGAYMMWVTLVQVGILLYVWLCNGHTIGDAGLLNLVLTANNTVIVGLPVMEATFPDMGGRLSLLTAFVLFLQVIPFSITAFEVEKWMVEDHLRATAAANMVSEPPSTPDRELSGRWVAEEPSSSGRSDGGAMEHRHGEGCSSSGGPAAEPPTPRASLDGADGRHGSSGRGADAIVGRARRRQSISRCSGSSTPGSSIGRDTVLVGGRLGRRRVGSGVVVGAMARGWAPATSLDSPITSSLDVSTRGKASGNRQVHSAALQLPLPAATSFGTLACPGMAPGHAISSLDHQHAVAPTSRSVALAFPDHAGSAPCPIVVNSNDGSRSDEGVVAARGCGSHTSTATVPTVDSPSVASFRCSSAPASIAASVAQMTSAFAFYPHLAATTASIRPNNYAMVTLTGAARSAPAVDPSGTSILLGLQTAASSPAFPEPLVTSALMGATTTAAGAQSHLGPHHAAAVPNALQQHLDMRLANSRALAGHCAASSAVDPVSGPVAQRLSGISGGTGGGGSGGGVVGATGGIQRWSLQAHWPPGTAVTNGRLEVAVADAGDLSNSATAPPPPLPPPPSGRLLSPVAPACPDLPVPQAINLARPMTSGPTVSTEARTSQNDYGPGRTAQENLVLAGNGCGGGNNDCSTRASVGRQLSTPAAAAAAEAGAVSLSVAPAVDAPPPPPPLPDRAFARAAAGSMTRRHGGMVPALGRWLKMRLTQYRRAWSITWVILKNPLLWSLLVALVINLSGLRSILWPGSSHYRPELGWVAGALSWTSGITVPVSLFSNGVWLYGKKFGRATLLQAGWILLIKLAILGPMQLACAAACGMEAAAAMSLLLLALCPVASTSFVIASQYGHGADLVTSITMLGIVLLVPVELVALALPRAFGLYHYQVRPATS